MPTSTPTCSHALRAAATDAADDGIEFIVNSGWRSAEYQEQLLDDAVSDYGSEEEAARWVATATTSAARVGGRGRHRVRSMPTTWLSEHGAAYGLCQIYGNEPWHYELRPDAVARAARPRTPTPRRIRGCSSDRRSHARHGVSRGHHPGTLRR